MTELSTETAFLRLVAAAILGGLIGLERERKNHGAGLRTTMLTSLAASLFTIIAINTAATLTVEQRVVVDPIRVIEAVTAGVAFLAAGTIVSKRGHVLGITTGASMWIAGAIGVACGTGYFVEAGIVTAITLVTLITLRVVDRWVSPDKD